MAIKDRIKLQTYLNDHLAGAMGAISLGKRSARNNQGTDLGDVLRRFVSEAESDKRSLQTIIRQLGFLENPLKKGMPWMAERLGRLKLNGELIRYSELSRLEELEALILGIRGKLNLWAALSEHFVDDPRLASIDFADLITRAETQEQRLEQYRARAAHEVFKNAA